MSYVPSFKYDVFISYAHIDNRPLTPGQRGWIDTFHTSLEARLGQVLGTDAMVWRDPQLRGNEHFDESLPRRVREAAILVSIVSPRYVQSEWCLNELKVFCESAEATGGLRIGPHSRVFKVLKTMVEDPELVPELSATVGYEFYEIDQSGIPRELDPDMGDEYRRGFRKKVDDVAYHIRELLKEFRDGAVVMRPLERAAPRSIFLAETTWDLRDERESLRRELRQRGLRVLPDGPLPHTPEFRERVREQIAQCQHSVHLIGSHYGVVPERETSSVTAIQHALAGERLAAGGTRIVWVPDSVEPADERQREFLHLLRTDPSAQAGTEMLEGAGIEELKTTIQDVVDRPLGEALKPRAPSEAGTDPVVYIICDRSDLDPCLSVQEYLFARNVEAILPLMEGDEAEIHEDHRQNLATCHAALVFWGQAGEAWLRAQLREILKAPGYGRTGPIPTQGVYVAPPSAAAKERYRTRQAVLLREEGTMEASLRPFLDRLIPAS